MTDVRKVSKSYFTELMLQILNITKFWIICNTLFVRAASLANNTASPRTLRPAPKERLASLAPLASGRGWSWTPLAWKNTACSVCLQKCVTGYPQCPRHAKTSKRPPEHNRFGHGFPLKKQTTINHKHPQNTHFVFIINRYLAAFYAPYHK